MNIFEQASRKKLRFTSNRGDLLAEQLWDLPLLSDKNLDLNTVAKIANEELKALTEDNFVETSSNPGKGLAELRLEIVKHVIEVKKTENAAKLALAEKANKRRVLSEALARRQDDKINSMSEEEILKELEALDS